MLLHFAEDGCLVEIGGHDVVLVFVLEVLDERFFEVDGEADCLEGHHEVPVLLEDAGQVVEGQYLEFAEGCLVGDVLCNLRQHHDVHCLRDELDVAAFLLLDVLHGQSVHLLHKLPHFLPQLKAQLDWLLFQHYEGEVDEFLLAKDALDGVAFVALAELAHNCPDV